MAGTSNDTEQINDADFGFNSDIYSDHTVCLRHKRSGGDKGASLLKVGVVKVILARASPFFKAIFEGSVGDPDSGADVTFFGIDDDADEVAIDPRELRGAYLEVLRTAHTGALAAAPRPLLPAMLHLADKYLFTNVADLVATVLETEVPADRALAMKTLAVCRCSERVALACVRRLAANLALGEVCFMLDLPIASETVREKVRGICSDFLTKEFGDWGDTLPESVLALDFPAFELLLQSDGLHVRSENVVYKAILEWLQYNPSRTSRFPDLWKHVRKYYLTTGFLMEVVANSDFVDEKEILGILKRRLGALHAYEWGKPRQYRNDPAFVDTPLVASGGRWEHTVVCNAVEVIVQLEARMDQTTEVTLSTGGYAPVLQRELQAAVTLKGGETIPCDRWIAGSSRVVVSGNQRISGVVLLFVDRELPGRPPCRSECRSPVT
eukprot:TRINITY_DN3773_c0_g1_i2.p1 TRINITY_DN3773_c0_g1~~TRINITY_DN3773_c0_g1_i2.p1  ORF type:complete len:447 (-),score=80.59 TRINITY_DN3773_c0_g1_i2:207-1523(-)